MQSVVMSRLRSLDSYWIDYKDLNTNQCQFLAVILQTALISPACCHILESSELISIFHYALRLCATARNLKTRYGKNEQLLRNT